MKMNDLADEYPKNGSIMITRAEIERLRRVEAELEQTRHLLRELWDSATLAEDVPGDLISRVFDELQKM